MEQAKFPRRQPGINAAYPHEATRKIDAKIAVVVYGRAALHLNAMAQSCAHAGHELSDTERL